MGKSARRRVDFMPDSFEHQWDYTVETFLDFKEAVHCAPSTIRGYRHTLRVFHERTKPDLNDSNGLRRAVLRLLKDYKNPYSYNLHRAYLRAFFNWCINEGLSRNRILLRELPPERLHLELGTWMKTPSKSC